VLAVTGYFRLPLASHGLLMATGASALLGMLGTAIASIIFYMLVKKSGIIFASLVTYGIPFVALGWGVWYGEEINLMQVTGLLVILTGVYLANAQWPQMVVTRLGKVKQDAAP
jgi:drug/metabolite transporter (DMT)-like permease